MIATSKTPPIIARQLGCPVSDSKDVRLLRTGTMTQSTLSDKGCVAGQVT
jgi:hypothetical protein